MDLGERRRQIGGERTLADRRQPLRPTQIMPPKSNRPTVVVKVDAGEGSSSGGGGHPGRRTAGGGLG